MLYAAHLFLLLVTALVSAVTLWWVSQQTRDRAGRVMVALLATHVAMPVLVAAELMSTTLQWAVVWQSLWYPIVLVNPVLWLLLAIYYTGRESWLTRPVRAWLAACVLVPAVLAVTNPVTGLLAVDYRFEPEPFVHMVTTQTALSGWLLVVVHLNVLLGVGLFLRMFVFSRRTARTQIVTILLGMLAIFVPAAATVAGRVPVQNFPYGVFGAGVFGVLVAVGIFRTRLFAVAPLARDTLFESLDDAIIVVDANRAIVDYNERAVDLFPALDSDLGDRLDDAYPAFVTVGEPSADGGGIEAMVEQLDGTSDSPFAGKVRLSTGHESRTLRLSVSEITSGGHLHGYALVVRDVTDLESYAIELEYKTTQLERFASTLSHDLRNPVAVAMGYVELERETNDSDGLRHAQTALERIDQTIDDLLTLSRDGNRIDERVPVSLSSIATEAWETSDTADATLVPDGDDVRLHADPSRHQTLLENLFRNAVDHGGTTVRIGPLADETRTGFYVADDGPGIPEGDRDRIFEYGYSSASDGTGLGLAIVASIVDAHGWEIAVTESEDGGARFDVTTIERRRAD